LEQQGANIGMSLFIQVSIGDRCGGRRSQATAGDPGAGALERRASLRQFVILLGPILIA
jgi:hypothetical protein